MGLRRQELRLSPEHLRTSPFMGFGFVESSVENVETFITRVFRPHFIATWRILARTKKICDCTNHGR
jgi:hypothetical protein